MKSSKLDFNLYLLVLVLAGTCQEVFSVTITTSGPTFIPVSESAGNAEVCAEVQSTQQFSNVVDIVFQDRLAIGNYYFLSVWCYV